MASNNNVLLGFIDKEITSLNQIAWSDNKIGGVPIWPENGIDNSLEIRCKLCSQFQCLVTQINCPLGDSAYHRILYIFCCINSTCWNKSESWSAIRCQIQDKSRKESDKPKPNSDWLEEAEWSDDDELCSKMDNVTIPATIHPAPSSPVVDLEEDMDDVIDSNVICEPELRKPDIPQFNSTVIRGVLSSDSNPVLKSFYLNVYEEPEEEDRHDEHVQILLNNYESNTGNPFKIQETTSKSAENYEKSDIKHGDKDFYKFCKRVKRCPEQVIRYCWSGEPLHIGPPNQQVANCDCGSTKVFEFQLMPALLSKLKLNNQIDTGDVVEFGTVLIYTCQKSCWDKNLFKIETVVVELDPYDN